MGAIASTPGDESLVITNLVGACGGQAGLLLATPLLDKFLIKVAGAELGFPFFRLALPEPIVDLRDAVDPKEPRGVGRRAEVIRCPRMTMSARWQLSTFSTL